MSRVPDSPLPPAAAADLAAAAGGRRAPPRRWSVAELCGPSGEAILEHNGEDYRLRVTSRGRLILTK